MGFVRHAFISPPRTSPKHRRHLRSPITGPLQILVKRNLSCFLKDSHDQWGFWSGVREICNYTESKTSIREKLSCKFYSEGRWVHKFADRIWQITYLSSFAACLRHSVWNYWTFNIVVVLSPLVNLMKDRATKLENIGISAVTLSDTSEENIWGLSREGFSLLFTEAQKLGWRLIGGGNVSKWLVPLVCGPWSATFPSMIKHVVEK